MPAWLRSERRLLALLLLAAALTRVAGGLGSAIITHDGSSFTYRARLLDHAQFGAALDYWPQMPPLYPLLIHLFHLALRGWELAGSAVSVIFGALTILPLFALTKSIAGARVAAVTSLLYGFMPQVVMLGGEVMTEPLFIFFFISWMALLWFASREPRWSTFVLAGLAGAAAYLTRPEGIYATIGTVGWCAIAAILRPDPPVHRGLRALQLAGGTACALGVFLAIASPYLLWIHWRTGKWSFTANPFASNIVDRLKGKPASPLPPQLDAFIDPETEYKVGRATTKYGALGGPVLSVVRESVKVCFYIFFPIGFLGLLLARRRGFLSSGIAFLIVFILGYTLPTIVGMMCEQPFGFRYIMPPCIFAMPFMALGSMELLGLLRRLPEKVPVRLIGFAISLAVLGAMVVKVSKPRLKEKVGMKQAGEWIRSEYGPDVRLGFMDRRVEHYAEGRGELIPPRVADLPSDLQLVVLYLPELVHFEPGYLERFEAGWREVRRFKDVRVYAPR